jgi:hypothetical protein
MCFLKCGCFAAVGLQIWEFLTGAKSKNYTSVDPKQKKNNSSADLLPAMRLAAWVGDKWEMSAKSCDPRWP